MELYVYRVILQILAFLQINDIQIPLEKGRLQDIEVDQDMDVDNDGDTNSQSQSTQGVYEVEDK